jgi:hypothetical protein
VNAEALAEAARTDAALTDGGRFSRLLVSKLELAYIAQWLDRQDGGFIAKAAETAIEAMHLLRTRP